MDLTINFKPPLSLHKIEIGDPIFSMGSCFAQHWGSRLESLGWPSMANSLGIVYNPASMQLIWEYILGERPFEANDWFENHDLWHHYDLHGTFSHPDRERATKKVEEALSRSREFLQNSKFGILTLGTSAVFVEKESGQVVNNCHKMPADQFREEDLSVQQCLASLQRIRELIESHTGIRSVIWTVSPIRHVRSGLIRNTRSKSRLILSVEEIIKEFPKDYYFPSYEMLMDVYRDARFFKEDLIHPRESVLQEIYDAFAESCFNGDALSCWNELKSFEKMRKHRILHPETDSAKAWQETVLNRKQSLLEKYSWLDLDQPSD